MSSLDQIVHHVLMDCDGQLYVPSYIQALGSKAVACHSVCVRTVAKQSSSSTEQDHRQAECVAQRQGQMIWVQNLVQDALHEDARLTCGSYKQDGKGMLQSSIQQESVAS